jgi:hypothetical protein
MEVKRPYTEVKEREAEYNLAIDSGPNVLKSQSHFIKRGRFRTFIKRGLLRTLGAGLLANVPMLATGTNVQHFSL